MALKFFILIVVLLITLVSCKVLPNIDKRLNFLRNRILNGNDAEIGEAPYIVSLKCTPHGDHICGGSIISKSVILTAAHCLNCPLYVVAGMHMQDNETGTQIVKVIKQIRHEQYEDNDDPYDIALLFLEKSLEFNSRVQPIELPEVDSAVTGEGKFFGWGLKGFEYPNTLQTTTTNILPHAKCQAVLKTLESNDPNILCTSSYLTTTCNADSGGPLVKNIDGNTVLVGILSYGTGFCEVLPSPVFFTKTQSYLEWIKDNVANLI